MKHNAITLVIWLVLLICVLEANIAAFNLTYHTYTNPNEDAFFLGNLQTDLMLLVVSLVSYGLAGCVIAWRVRVRFNATVLALLIGTLGLGLEFSSSYPWFLMMPSHPSLYDRALAFLGPSIPPLSSMIGALLFSEIQRKRNGANAL